MTIYIESPGYYSLNPKDTALWKLAEHNHSIKKIALIVVSVVVVPLEMLARCFYNLGMWIYSLFYQRSITPSIQNETVETIVPQAPPRLDLPDLTRRAVAAAERSIPDIIQYSIITCTQGTFYGQAVGDNLGILTSSLTRDQAQQLKAESLNITRQKNFENINPYVRNFLPHRWTDNMDRALTTVRVEKEHLLDPSKPKEWRIAQQLDNLYHHGLNSFSSVDGFAFASHENPAARLRAPIKTVIEQPTFKENPHAAAIAVWKEHDLPMHLRSATNGAMIGTSMLGIMYYKNIELAVQEAIRYAKITHADPRSIASAVAVTVAIALLQRTDTSKDIEQRVIQPAEEVAVCVLWEEMEKAQDHLNANDRMQWREIAQQFEMELRACMHAQLNELKLDEQIDYAFKGLGAGFYALRYVSERPLSAITSTIAIREIMFEGGDADSNASIASALIGACVGVFAIPIQRYEIGQHNTAVLSQGIDHVKEIADTVMRP